ncbi:MAG: hypothetical protein IJP90_07945 [Treponema sp.]|nr:hypothetical protein [Treponema sp.]MBR0099635.1 hypothetical protein [Treponema sp.]
MNRKLTFMLSIFSVILIGCNKSSNNVNTQNKAITYKPNQKTEVVVDKSTYRISESDVYVYNRPNGEKIKNQKLSSVLGETHYIQVDTDCTVEVVEKKDEWVKIHTVYPDWLQDTHNGWILAKYLYNFSEIKISDTEYKILKEVSTTVNNIYVLYLGDNFSKKKAIALNEYLRNSKKLLGNIYIFDDEKASELIDNNSLEKDNYVFLADHFIAMSTFDIPKSVIYYPYQDNQYKALGGKNFKN